MIEIRFKSNVDFSGDTGVYKTSVYQTLIKEGRIVKVNTPSLSIVDNWKGQDITVQQTIWNGYFVQLNLNESQVNLINIISACRDITITDTENNLSITVDNSNSEFFIVEFIEFKGETSSQTALIRFRGDKKVINLKQPTEQTNYIKVDSTFYYTDQDVMLSSNIPKIETVDGNNALKVSVSSDYKQVMSFMFYTDETIAASIVSDLANIDISNITVFNGTVYNLLENIIVTPEILGEGLYKVLVPCVIDSERFYL